ncbi:putative M48 family peptidase [Hamiltosporidium magnivora]|uniref:Putative M48 family peptidase n=1 Tax=Hamiltosporidium magnivora TaxID=148818 RepID=A0A4Q9LN87_9MICR|nr:putative M48 family peptidase [Hamiltosporidium magnivora]
MKKISKNFIYSVFIITLLTITYEIFSISKFRYLLSKGELGIATNSNTYVYASRNPEEFIISQEAASKSKIFTVTMDFVKHSVLVAIALLFLDSNLQRMMLKLAEKRVTLVKSGFRDLKKPEINFVCLLYSFYLITIFVVGLLTAKSYAIEKILKCFGFFVAFYLLLAPVLVFITYILLSKFHKKFIIACFIAYAIKVLPDILIQDKVDYTKMTKMDINEFPENIQEVLIKYDLQDRVYKEIFPGKEINAALIGYGDGKRMEIYGNYDEFDQEQLYSVFLHEVGHAKENSLLRKTIIYFIVLVLEMLVFLFLYDRVSSKFSNQDISYFTAFLVLAFIYRVLLRQWLFSIYKLGSQISEINSDLFAKQYGYDEYLANTLYDIGIQSSDYLFPTVIYNSLRSGHPSLYSRIEYLNG